MFKFIKELFSKEAKQPEQPINIVDGLVLPMPDDPRWIFKRLDEISYYTFNLGPVIFGYKKSFCTEGPDFLYFLEVDKLGIDDRTNACRRYCEAVHIFLSQRLQDERAAQQALKREAAKKALEEFSRQKETPCD
jgi:hypothetical protein